MVEFVNNPHSENMVRYGRERENTLVLSGDLTGSTEIAEFKKQLPEKFVSMGMAEQNMLSWAGGLAREGYVPFLHTFAVFLYRRPYDQLSMSVAYPNLKVRLVGFLPGIMTPGGVTHQAIEDISVVKSIPNMTIFETGDATDVETVLDATDDINGPIYIRMLRGRLPRLFPKNEPFKFNTARILNEGDDITVLSSGICTEEAMKAVELLKEKGVHVKHLHISTLKPFTDERVVKALHESKNGVITLENHSTIGGLGSAVADVIAENGITTKLTKIGIPDKYAHGASAEYLMRKFGLDALGLLNTMEEALDKKFNITEEQVKAFDLKVEQEDIKDTQLEAL
ncbi:transketolase family protein [Virgibacillus pantothenticus]|uniref:transketolase family protein n=1 Tax=Virgibacillus pantothenticus TaxID=1473 RepID=UPI000984DD62|nr:transketolase C-terminal domain-containing protein [Virgibacillus pantothenticus]